VEFVWACGDGSGRGRYWIIGLWSVEGGCYGLILAESTDSEVDFTGFCVVLVKGRCGLAGLPQLWPILSRDSSKPGSEGDCNMANGGKCVFWCQC
jgi:hypothetical protein